MTAMSDADLTRCVLSRIADYFHDLDDSDEQPFGDFANVVKNDARTLILCHEDGRYEVVLTAVVNRYET